MGRVTNLMSEEGVEKSAWLHTREERTRLNLFVKRWKDENPNATLFQEFVARKIIGYHLFGQRLLDERVTFFGDKTVRIKLDDHHYDLDDESRSIKRAEFDKYFKDFEREQREWTKLALASKVELTSDFDLATLVQDYQNKRNGQDSNHYTTRGRIPQSSD